jgi:uncharacterized protein with HEPN domain
MQPKSAKWLWDIRRSGEFILSALEGRSLEEYQADPLRRAAVERHFGILGEAMSQLARRDPETAGLIDGYPQIIAFRNVLIHGYRDVDNTEVFAIARDRLPGLLALVEALLAAVPLTDD